MRLLHTADWHLGHRLYDRDRSEEHRRALAWLLEVVEREEIDLLIVAGDVFDVTNPSNQARKLYYDFLTGLIASRCAAAVIVGGNHDSAHMLDAPEGIMRAAGIHVVGCARDCAEEQIIPVCLAGQSEPCVYVAAVPYLRERDVRKGHFGESAEERLRALRQGIQQHFTDVAAAAEAARHRADVPMIVTGHLFAAGAEDDADKISYIYQADEQNMRASQFPACFDYVALGHVHRAQSIDGQDRVRYAGSLVPLSFEEGSRQRSVRIVDLGPAGQPVRTRKLQLPFARPLVRARGDVETVKHQLRTAALEYAARLADGADLLRPWVEVQVVSDDPIANLGEMLRKDVAKALKKHPGVGLDVIRLSTVRQTERSHQRGPATVQLAQLRPRGVFTRVLAQMEFTEQTNAELEADFLELINFHQEQDPA